MIVLLQNKHVAMFLSMLSERLKLPPPPAAMNAK
jgi:hypothetical protein